MASNPEGAAAARDYQQGAASRNSPFFSVVLSCGLEENLRRVQTAGRGGATNTKLTDVDIVCNIREMEDIYHFKDQNELDLDVTEILPTEAAQRILDHIAEIHECQ